MRLTRKELAAVMVADCLAARDSSGTVSPKLVFSSNGQGVALAGRDSRFDRAMAEADIIHADGMSVVTASRRTGTPLPERIATTDFIHDAARVAVENDLRFFLLGGTEQQNARAMDALRMQYPTLDLAGGHHGYFNESEDERVCALVVASGADVVWVGLGRPRQEFWSVANQQRLTGVAWVKTCGGLFGFLSGDARRAPMWMQRLGLEWLHRAILEPRRLGWRYLTTNPYAAYRLVRFTERASDSRL